MLRQGLTSFAPEVFAYVQGNQNSSSPLTLGGNLNLGSYLTGKGGDPTLATPPAYLKAVRRGTVMAALASGDGVTWEQLWGGVLTATTPTVYAGLAVLSADATRFDSVSFARGRFRIVADPVVSIPVASLTGTATANTYTYKTKVTVTLVPAASTDAVRYTLDGSDPVLASPLFSAPFDLTTIGSTVLKAKAFAGGNTSGTLVLMLTVTP